MKFSRCLHNLFLRIIISGESNNYISRRVRHTAACTQTSMLGAIVIIEVVFPPLRVVSTGRF